MEMETDMDAKMLTAGTFYKDSDENIYQIRCIAKDKRDRKDMVVYQEMFFPYNTWVTSLDDFDFTSVSLKDVKSGNEYKSEKELFYRNDMDNEEDNKIQIFNDEIKDSEIRDAFINGTVEKKLVGKIPDSEIARRGFMEFLDAGTYHDKYLIFLGLKPYLDTRILNNMAVSLDVVLDEGTLEEQYDSLKSCIQTMEHYENTRLR